MVRGACWPGSTHGLPNIGFVTFVMVWMVAIWDFLTHNGKLTGIFRFLSVFKKKRENQEKQKKCKKNGLEKSVKLRKKSVQIGNYRSNPIAFKKTYPFESVQKAFEKRSKTVRNRSTLRKMLRKMKDFSRSKPCRPQSHLDHSGKTWFKTLTLFRFTIRSWRAGKDFTAVY